MKKEELSVYKIIKKLQQVLSDVGIDAKISVRIKDLYSILKKMERKKVRAEQLNDVVAFRIIVDTIDTCYKALEIVHDLYEYEVSKDKDFISNPKNNGYQSMHSTLLIGEAKRKVECQIRTAKMHDIAEDGSAAHWKYKLEKEKELPPTLNNQLNGNLIVEKTYNELDNLTLTEKALIAYEQKINDIWQDSMSYVQQKRTRFLRE